MSDKINSNISYTNKDFQSIYNELLDLVKKLSTKWDPSLSNESDPGVLLLKLNALIADKNNYNIDKNVLECFPLSVTQDGNARKLYDSLGYKMSWYNSATTQVGFQLRTLSDLTTDEVVTIPAQTYLNDSTGEKIYTTLQKVELSNTTDINYTDVIEGKVVDYDINGDTLITINNLDNDLRLYFDDTMIAENGIFVKNSEDTYFYNPNDSTAWKRVDNLASYPLGSKVFEFGVLPNSNTCYIQFPQDITNLIENGLNIQYTVSTGVLGNIKSNTLISFYSDITNSSGDAINDNIRIVQINASTNGSDPEDLASAYNNYKKTIGTFNTLVTKRDYENYLYKATIDNKNLCSNVYVADRTNDINQSSYIQTWTPDGYKKELDLIGGTGFSEFNAYNICLYMFKPVTSVFNELTYNQTFDPYNSQEAIESAESLIDEIKSVQHDIKQVPYTSNYWYALNNIYQLKGTLYTYHKITTQEKKDIENNVKQALFTKYNSRNVNFGEELDYSDIVDVITEADSRIKNVALNNLSYNTYKVVANSDSAEAPNYDSSVDLTDDDKAFILAKMILNGNAQLFKFDDEFNYDFGQTKSNKNNLDEYSIQSISSQALITLPTITSESASSSGYTLRENESIRLISENLVTIMEYTTYVKYSISSTGSDFTISANTSYKLGANESIKLNYTDSNNLPQEVYLQTGDIVESSIDLKSSSDSSISGSKSGTLASGQYIRKKIVNSQQLDYGSKYYFILNNPSNTLELDQTTNYYILGENEYFLYTSANTEELIIFGSGTKISIPANFKYHASISNYDVSTISSQDISSIDWCILGKYTSMVNDVSVTDVESLSSTVLVSDFKFTITEMNIITLAQGAIVGVKNSLTNDVDNNLVSIDSTNIIYYKNTADDEKWTELTNGVVNWQIQSRLAINVTTSTPQILLSKQTIDFDLVGSTDVLTVESGESLLFNTSVILSGGVNLDAKVLDEQGNLSYTLKAYIYSLSKNTDWTPSNATGIFTRDVNSNLMNLLGNISKYVLPYNFGSTELDLNKSYLIPVYLSSQSSNFKVTFKTSISGAETEVELFNPTKSTQDKATNLVGIDSDGNIGMTYILNIKKGTNLIISSSNGSQTDLINIGKIVKLNGYNEEEIGSILSSTVEETGDTFLSYLYNAITDIDPNNKFYWAYTVPTDDKVLDPLSASAYWNTNHVYNKYILPKIDFNNYNITVSSTSIT